MKQKSVNWSSNDSSSECVHAHAVVFQRTVACHAELQCNLPTVAHLLLPRGEDFIAPFNSLRRPNDVPCTEAILPPAENRLLLSNSPFRLSRACLGKMTVSFLKNRHLPLAEKILFSRRTPWSAWRPALQGGAYVCVALGRHDPP